MIMNFAEYEKEHVLMSFYSEAEQIGMGLCQLDVPVMTREEARTLIESSQSGWVDYVNGRYIKINFSQYPLLDLSSYVSRYGEQKLQKVRDVLRCLSSSGAEQVHSNPQSSEPKQCYEEQLQYLGQLLKNVVSQDRLCVLATQEVPAALRWSRAFAEPLSKLDSFVYIGRRREFSDLSSLLIVEMNGSQLSEKFENKSNWYCESTFNPLNPGAASFFKCNSMIGLLKCVGEQKKLGCNTKIYSSEESIEAQLPHNDELRNHQPHSRKL
ncbi:MAG: hypothetical protein U1E78_06970 [Gammaproteobacteria bacterium]